MEQPANISCSTELKASIPDDILGNAEDTAHWLLAMTAYFGMDQSIYDNDTKTLTAHNKMSKRSRKFFSEA
jgi:hypothetical protein